MARRTSFPAIAAALAACLWAVPGPAQEASVPPGDIGGAGATPLQERALAAMEALRDELQVLASIRDAQAALLAWNRESARTGVPPAALPAALCRDPALAAWCPLLPATFGVSPTENIHDRAHDRN